MPISMGGESLGVTPGTLLGGGHMEMGKGTTSHLVIDVRVAQERLKQAGVRLVERATIEGVRQAAYFMKVDTGWSRGHLSYDVTHEGQDVTGRFGILHQFNMQDGANVAAYAAMMNSGIKRHFVSFWNRSGSLRTGLVNWCERHGLKIWRGRREEVRLLERGPYALTEASYGRSLTDKGRGLASRGLWVWGYAHPWLNTARDAIIGKYPQFIKEQENTL